MQKLVIKIIAVVKEAMPNMPIKRSDVVKAIVVRTKKTIRRQVSPRKLIFSPPNRFVVESRFFFRFFPPLFLLNQNCTRHKQNISTSESIGSAKGILPSSSGTLKNVGGRRNVCIVILLAPLTRSNSF